MHVLYFRTYLIPQWLLVFLLPLTIAVYIVTLATDHWLAEVFVSLEISLNVITES